VNQGHRPDAALAVSEDLGGLLVADLVRLKVQQTRNHLQVVFDAMVDLLQQYFLFLQGSANFLVAALSLGNVFITPEVIMPIPVHGEWEVIPQKHPPAFRHDFFRATLLTGSNDLLAARRPDLVLAKYEPGFGSENGLNRRGHIEHLAESGIQVNDPARLILNDDSRMQVVDE